MRFIHTADWQLGKPFGRAPQEARLALQEARLDAIDVIAAAARREEASLVLVAGDVFDSAEPGDRVYRQALARMKAAHDVQWILLPGNHDPARADGLWWRLGGEAPNNVLTCLESAVLNLSDEVYILPAPLLYKRSVEDPTAWFDHAETPEGHFRVGLAHGSIRDFTGGGEGANQIAPDRATRSRLHYLALGDWHGRTAIGDRTFYSGTPEPDDFGRAVTGVALLIDLEGARATPRVKDILVARHVWREETCEIASVEALGPALEAMLEGLDRSNLVLRLNVSGLVTLAERVAIIDRLEGELAHEVRWLDLRMSELLGRPTDHDLTDIDAHGVLREAAERLRALSGEPGVIGRHASVALERLYVEHQRAAKQVAD